MSDFTVQKIFMRLVEDKRQLNSRKGDSSHKMFGINNDVSYYNYLNCKCKIPIKIAFNMCMFLGMDKIDAKSMVLRLSLI